LKGRGFEPRRKKQQRSLGLLAPEADLVLSEKGPGLCRVFPGHHTWEPFPSSRNLKKSSILLPSGVIPKARVFHLRDEDLP
jgi:hypothetical protein